METGKSFGLSLLLLMMTQIIYVPGAWAFPPYRTTDADTADPYTLELRVGLIKVERERSEIESITPLLRTNFGLPNKIELISEFEYLPEEGEFGDGAVGIKWVPQFGNSLSFGIETLALLPVRPGDESVGVESQLLVTYWSDDVRIHANAGGFHDGRVSPAKEGWRASVLAEFPREKYRLGVELFAKDTENESTDVRIGVGMIYNLGTIDIRSSLHAGLTDKAPDISFNLWISTKLSF